MNVRLHRLLRPFLCAPRGHRVLSLQTVAVYRSEISVWGGDSSAVLESPLMPSVLRDQPSPTSIPRGSHSVGRGVAEILQKSANS